MNLNQALKRLPGEEIISIGCENAPGWFYFSKVEDVDTEKLFNIMTEKQTNSITQKRYNISMLKSDLKSPKYINNCTLSGYLNGWWRLIKYEKDVPRMEEKLSRFTHPALLETEVSIYRKSDKTLGILLKDWEVAGSYWYLKEWEDKHGKI